MANKIITAQRLLDGVPVYLTPEGDWSDVLGEAKRFDADAAQSAVAQALTQETVVVGVYLVDTDESGALSPRHRLREMIRASKSPTAKPDMGKTRERA